MGYLIGGEWLVILAITVSMTFVSAAPANSFAHAIYARWSEKLKRFEKADRMPEEAPIDTGSALIAVMGMGGVGTSAYEEMRRGYGEAGVGFADLASLFKTLSR